MTDFVAELRSLRTQAFRRLLHNADFRVLLALDKVLAELESPAGDLSLLDEGDILPALRSKEAANNADPSAQKAEPETDVDLPLVDADIFAEEEVSAEEAQQLVDAVDQARAEAIAAHRAMTGSDEAAGTVSESTGELADEDHAEHVNGNGAAAADGDPLTSIFTGPMPDAPSEAGEDEPIERLTPRNDAYEAALNRLNTLIERASNQLRATSG